MPKKLICIAKIFSAHGIKGAVKIKSFTEDPMSVADYSPLYNKDGSQTFNVKVQSCNQDVLIAAIDGVSDRNEAEKLRGKELYIYRDALPEAQEGEFLYDDLVGLRAKLENGKEYGKIIAVHNFGAGDIIEIKLKDSNNTELFPFKKEVFPTVNLQGGFALLVLPEALDSGV